MAAGWDRSAWGSLPGLTSCPAPTHPTFAALPDRQECRFHVLRSAHPDDAGGSGRLDASCLRSTPGFLPQFGWNLGRAVLRRSREPLAVFTDYGIIALTGGGQGRGCTLGMLCR